MKDNSGFTNWETERMYEYALNQLQYLSSFENTVQKLRSYEDTIRKTGEKKYLLYFPDPVNYWEVYARLSARVIEYLERRFETGGKVIPKLKELNGG